LKINFYKKIFLENNSIKSKTSTISPPPRPERTVQQIINNPLNSPSSPPPIPPKRVGQSGQVNDKEENRWSRKSSKIEFFLKNFFLFIFPKNFLDNKIQQKKVLALHF